MSNRSTPIVPHVLYVAEQCHPWRMAPYERLATRYHTPTTIAIEFGTIDLTVKPIKGKTGVSKQQTHVYCLADEDAWRRVQQERAALQAHLDALADGLRDLGGYAKRLEEAGGIKKAPNRLSPTVISAPDPDLTKDGYFINNPVPRIGREQITSHTPKMLHVERNGEPWSVSHQRDHFVCPDDAAWERIQALVAAVQRAADAWKKLLQELGTYHSALADKRYAQRAAAAPARASVPTTWPALGPLHKYGHHRNATSGGIAHIWMFAPTKRAKQRHTTLCHIVMTEAPRRIDPTASGLRLCAECRKAAAALTTDTPQEESTMPKETQEAPSHNDTWHNLPPKLAGWKWETNQVTNQVRLLAPDERWWTKDYTSSNKAIAEALRRVNSQPKSTAIEPVPTGALSTALQDCARRYVAARERAGAALLEMAAVLAEAREQAQHGAWYTFLEAIGTSEDQADRLLDIHDQAEQNPQFAEAIRRNFLNPTTAALLARPSTPMAVVEAVLAQPEPPSKRQVEQQIQEARGVEIKSRTGAGFAPLRPNAPPGWVWRESGALRRIADGRIVGPYAHSAATVAAAERADQERTSEHTEAIAASGAGPTTDAGRVGAIRRYLAQQGAPRVYTKEVFDTAWKMASEIYDGDTWRAICQEIHTATNSGKGRPSSPPVARAPEAAPRDLTFTCERCGRDATQYVNVAGLMEHRCAACGTLPIRPARPPRDDVSVLLDYLHDLEEYATALEQALERSGEYGPVPTLQEVEA